MDTSNKIERYILGHMTEAEKVEFEKELENNQLLKEQLEFEQNIVAQIHNRGFVNKQINTAKKEMQRGKITRLISYSVSSIAALLLVFFFVLGAWQGQKYDKLYTSNFTVYTNDFIVTDGTTRGDAELEFQIITHDSLPGETEIHYSKVLTDKVTAMAAYEKKDFTTAETQFNQILSENDTPEIRFYLAITQMGTGKTKEALKTLQLLYSQPIEYRYYEQTRWYMALVHLKLHHKTEAKKYLDELVAMDGVYLDKAKELKSKL